MQLRDYLHMKDITEREFARQINYTNNFISDIIRMRKKAGRKMIEVIEKVTDGAVSKQDMRKLNLQTEERLQKVIVEKQAKEQACAEIN